MTEPSEPSEQADDDGFEEDGFTFELHGIPLPPPPPSTAKLASLAAQLASGSESKSEDFVELAKRALLLWNAAQTIQSQIPRKVLSESEYRKMMLQKCFERAGLVLPPEDMDFTLDQALACVMPQKRKADRENAIREFLTEMEGSGTMKKLPERGVYYDQFCRFAERFLPWLDARKRRVRAEAGSTGGKARGTNAADEKAKAALKNRER